MYLKIRILILITLLQGLLSNAYGVVGDGFNWMDSNIQSFSPPCIKVPDVSGVNQANMSLSTNEEGVWIPTGIKAHSGKSLSISWSTRAISPRSRKYRVLYRVDPRFIQPQVFVQEYDYTQEKYVSDFNIYADQILPFYQERQEITSGQRVNDYDNYFNFISRPVIYVQRGEVVNITLDDTGEFFGSEGDMQGGLNNYTNPALGITTDSAGLRNKIMYASATRWCDDIITSASSGYASQCLAVPGRYVNTDSDGQISLLTGDPTNSDFTSKILSIPSCPDNSDGNANDPVCFYDKGRGFDINIDGFTIKDRTQKFVYSPFSDKYFLYYYSDLSGVLNFNTPWPIYGMYNGFLQLMTNWIPLFTGVDDETNLIFLSNYLSNNISDPMNFLHFGIYSMEIEIGHSDPSISPSLNNINIDYIISESDTPNSSSTGNEVSRNFTANAADDGWLWLRISGTSGLVGIVDVNITSYTGSTWFSTLVYDDIVTPLRDKYNELSRIIYEKLVSNATLQNIGKTALVLYIIVYGLVFLIGSVQITATDIIIRVLKITIIVILFSETSWLFFNDNLFVIFIDGTEYLLNSIIGNTSSVGNIFGFVDPIFERYSNGNFWALLFIQLLQLTNGVAFFACLTIYSILSYFRAVLEVIINYCLAFLAIAVMISLAPFFIILILFERTRSMFDSWLSTLFSYMIQPTILLIFFLLIDQLMAEYIGDLVVEACWGTLIPLGISLDLLNLQIPMSFSFPLPFLSDISFYIPQVKEIESSEDFFTKSGTFIRIAQASFVFFIYCKLASGLIEYVTLVTQFLTNVLAARQDGRLQGTGNTVKDITNDMERLASPITSGVKKVGRFAKSKIIDQKITHRTRGGQDDPDYSDITRQESEVDESKSRKGDKEDAVIRQRKGGVELEEVKKKDLQIKDPKIQNGLKNQEDLKSQNRQKVPEDVSDKKDVDAPQNSSLNKRKVPDSKNNKLK